MLGVRKRKLMIVPVKERGMQTQDLFPLAHTSINKEGGSKLAICLGFQLKVP